MSKYVLQKLLGLVAVQFGITLVVFVLIRLVPGDTVDVLYGQTADPVRQAEIRALFGLDRPIHVQYFEWMGELLRGDLGKSIISGRPIIDELLLRFPVTLQLSAMAAAWAVVVGVTLGAIAGSHPYGKSDSIITPLASLGLATPSFWLASLLVLFMSVKLGWFPAIGYTPFGQDPLGSIRHLVLPSLSLGMVMSAAVMRMTRSAMLEVTSQDYIRTARSKGLVDRIIMRRHALKNALIPVVTVIGIEAGKMLGGSLIIEQIFVIPGIGQYSVSAIISRDYPVLQGAVLLIATTYVVVNLLVDISYPFLDPRVTYD